MVLRLFKLFLFLIFFAPTIALAWSDCPFAKINDKYPGSCALYIDSNQDGICDHSQPKPIGVKKDFGANNAKNNSKQANKAYPVIFLIILTIVLYAVTYSLSQTKKISLAQHYLFWNWALLLSFLVSGCLGVLLALEKNFHFFIPLPFTALNWHINAGIIMFVISLFHINRHKRYFFTKKDKKK